MSPRCRRHPRLANPFRWVGLLPWRARAELAGELLRTARDCAATARPDRFRIVLNAWRATAEAHAADPGTTGGDLDYLEVPEAVLDPRTAP